MAETYRALRRFREALSSLERGIELAPDNALNYERWADYLMDSGDLDGARKVLSEAPVTDPMQFTWSRLEFLDRNFEAALEHAELMPRERFRPRRTRLLLRADSLLHLDRREEAREDLQALASEIEDLIASGYPAVGSFLGLTYAHLGRREHAIREIERQIDLDAQDLFDVPWGQRDLAYVYAMFGEAEAAIEILDQLLVTSYNAAITVERLRLDPRLDPLRDHPRFQALLEKYGQDE